MLVLQLASVMIANSCTIVRRIVIVVPCKHVCGYGTITMGSCTNAPTAIVIICCQYVDLGYYIDVIIGNMVIGTIVKFDNPWVILLKCF